MCQKTVGVWSPNSSFKGCGNQTPLYKIRFNTRYMVVGDGEMGRWGDGSVDKIMNI
ncbi:hypothetical protein [Okeania sp.]|uniref:hypothetical protein n=1 Tax=Okeania sp. TaxID=3100323 RepID=UPI002B4AB804|nr:hypothetical protein [Okeania sp.]